MAGLAYVWMSLYRHGPSATVLRVRRRLRPNIRRIVLFGLARPRVVFESGAPRDLMYRFASLEEAGACHAMRPEDAVKAMALGDRCLLQFELGRIVGYIWVAVSPVVFLTEGLHLPLPDDSAASSS
jgi:hypothetical protein